MSISFNLSSRFMISKNGNYSSNLYEIFCKKKKEKYAELNDTDTFPNSFIFYVNLDLQ